MKLSASDVGFEGVGAAALLNKAWGMPCLVILWLLLPPCGLAGELKPGHSVYGKRQYIEYMPGDLPLVIAVPHGGRLTPDDMPDRTSGVVEMDANTQELGRAIADVVHKETGHHAYVIICHLHRKKLDVNREIAEAAQGNSKAEAAWKEHHAFVDQACEAAVKKYGVAFLIDLHGHGHPVPHAELGYLQGVTELSQSDAALNEKSCVSKSSLCWLVEHGRRSHAELLHGASSLGALLEENGFPASPSPRVPVPPEPFFRGGYTIARHCRSEQNVTGLQIETNRPRLRDTEGNRLKFAQALCAALQSYFSENLGFGLDGQKSKARVVK